MGFRGNKEINFPGEEIFEKSENSLFQKGGGAGDPMVSENISRERIHINEKGRTHG